MPHGLALANRVLHRSQTLAERLATPGRGFHGAWAAAFAAQGVGGWLGFRAEVRRGEYDVPAFAAYLTQLGLTFAWAMLFFGLRRPAIALAEICALWLAIAATIVEFSRRHRYLALLLFPYLVWASYATVVNGAAWWTARRR
jgi:tryptophan-rich sensory protein